MWTLTRIAIGLALLTFYSVVCYELGKLKGRRDTQNKIITHLRPHIRQNIRPHIRQNTKESTEK